MSEYEEIRSALAYVPPYDYETWIKVAMALKSELEDSSGFELFTEWSQADERYNEREARAKWRSIEALGGITIRTLFGMAVDRGWKPEKKANGKGNGCVLSKDELADRERKRQQQEAKEAQRRQSAKERAAVILDASKPAPIDHPYLQRKSVRSVHGLRLYSGSLVIDDMRCDGALIVPVRDSAGELHSLQFISETSEKRFLRDGGTTGCYFSIGRPKNTLVICEGLATSDSVHAATGLATACAFSRGNLAPVAKALRAKLPDIHIIIGADHDPKPDGTNPGLEKAQDAARLVDGLVAVPEIDGAKCDFNDLLLARGAEAVRAAIEAARPAPEGSAGFVGKDNGTNSDTWPEPKPLENALPPVKTFTAALMPDALRDWVMDVAERTQAPVEYVAVSAMVSLSAALGRKVAIRPKRLDDWCEFANLWGAVIGPPSWMKSPALDEGKRPLAIIEARMLEDYELNHREWEAESEAAKVKREGAKDRARKAAREGKSFDKMELIAAPIPEEPKPTRLIINDATVPALCDVLRANPNGVLVFRDELAGLIAELDHEGMEGSRGFYLTGWSGKDGHTQDRIARGTNLRVPYVCLSMLGGIQPARVAPILRESIATGGGDGFLARFTLAVWPDSPGEYRAMDREPNSAAREKAYAVYRHLHELTPAEVGAETVDGMAPFLRLEPAAAEAFTEWDVQLRNRMRFGGDDGALVAHLLKYPKAVCALALLTHLADGGTGDISAEAILRALAWAEFLESHARRIYASMGQAHIDSARSLLTRLKRGDLESPFTMRDVYRRGWAHLPDVEAARAAADVLEAHHYIRSTPIETGGRPSVAYYLNPSVRS